MHGSLVRLAGMAPYSSMTPANPNFSKLLLSVALYMGVSVLVAALAEKKKFAHVFKQLGQ